MHPASHALSWNERHGNVRLGLAHSYGKNILTGSLRGIKSISLNPGILTPAAGTSLAATLVILLLANASTASRMGVCDVESGPVGCMDRLHKAVGVC